MHGIARDARGVRLRCDAGDEHFDDVVLACHSDQALALLADADAGEREVLGAIRYHANTAVRRLPKCRSPEGLGA